MASSFFVFLFSAQGRVAQGTFLLLGCRRKAG